MSIRNHVVLGLVAAGVSAFATTLIVRADDKAAPPAMDEAAMQKLWMDYGIPGTEHMEMAKRVGTWEATVEDFSQGEPVTSMGTCKRSMLFDGKYMREDFESSFKWNDQEFPFVGVGTLGFDKGSNEFFYFWIDSMGTGYSFSRGKRGDGNKSEMNGEMTTPMGKVKTRIVVTMVDDNTDVMEMYSDMGMMPKEMLCMRITNKRKS